MFRAPMKKIDWFLIGVGVLLSLGCVSRVALPDTREAQACNRECMGIFNSCNLRRGQELSCAQQKHDCLLTCPGAKEVDD